MKLGLPHWPPPLVWIAVPAAIATVTAGGCGNPGSPGGGATSGGTSAASVSLQTRNGPPGTYLTDQGGRTLYLFASDAPTRSTCTGACASAWPPLHTSGTVGAGSGVSASDITTITRGDGTQQVVYHAHPLYYFAGDSAAGQTNGQGSTAFGARWWLLTASGQSLTASASPSVSHTSARPGY